jgi:hypothetical protein
MSRFFDDVYNVEGLWNDGGSSLTTEPLSLACWFYADADNLQLGLISMTKDGANPLIKLAAQGAVAGDRVLIGGYSGGEANTTTGFSVNTWHHACGVYESTTNRHAYIDGGSKGSDTTSNTSDTVTDIGIGNLIRANPIVGMSGRIAEVGIWNVALTDAEVAILAKGYSPLFVRPQNLVVYVPLVGDEDVDIVGGLAFAELHTPGIADHPRIIRPASGWLVPQIARIPTFIPKAIMF